jgi:UDP-2,3-diacylglucosamine hydrolase
MTTLFVSDLHLHPARPAVCACFIDFVAAQAGQAQALYILGDLFDAWVGDDHPEPAYEPVKQALARCGAAGTPVFVLHGNRDFLLGEQFARQTGCTLLADPVVIDLYGERALLMHGDSLCTDDVDYQRMRQRLRDPAWQAQALALPLTERLELAQQARELSALSNRGKDEIIMDVNPDAVLRAFATYDVGLLIHGHTHRPGLHRIPHADRELRRFVLGDWYRHGNVLSASPDGLAFKTLPVGSEAVDGNTPEAVRQREQ